MVLWGLVLVVTLLVPALHQGDRQWWPWTCVAGMAGGGLALLYIRRGRGNAEGANLPARSQQPTDGPPSGT